MQNFSTIALFENQTAIPMTAFAFLCWKAQRARTLSFATDCLPPLAGGNRRVLNLLIITHHTFYLNLEKQAFIYSNLYSDTMALAVTVTQTKRFCTQAGGWHSICYNFTQREPKIGRDVKSNPAKRVKGAIYILALRSQLMI